MVPTTQALQAFAECLAETPEPPAPVATHFSITPGTLNMLAFGDMQDFFVTALDADDNVVLDYSNTLSAEVTPIPDLGVTWEDFVDGVCAIHVATDEPGTFLVLMKDEPYTGLNGGCNVNVT
jgi:hypothetical protein